MGVWTTSWESGCVEFGLDHRVRVWGSGLDLGVRVWVCVD